MIRVKPKTFANLATYSPQSFPPPQPIWALVHMKTAGAPDGIWDWYGRAQRYVTRARSARAPKGGSGGPPPEFFLK